MHGHTARPARSTRLFRAALTTALTLAVFLVERRARRRQDAIRLAEWQGHRRLHAKERPARRLRAQSREGEKGRHWSSVAHGTYAEKA